MKKSAISCPTKTRTTNNRYPDKIKRELERILKTGFQTAYGGSFFLIPYLLHLDPLDKIKKLEVEKHNGIPVEKAVLALIQLGIAGIKRISRVKKVTDPGLEVFAGLGKLPSSSFFHNFLGTVKMSDVENFIISCSRRFKEMGLYKGKIVNLDRHFMGYYGKKRIKKDKHPTRNVCMRGVNLSLTHDQESGDPIFLRPDYPGLKPAEVAIPMITKTRDILGGDMETLVFDKWFSVGALLDYINRKMELKYVTLLKLFQNRIEEMRSVPPEKFREMADGRKIAFVHTNLRNYQGDTGLIVIQFQEDGEDKYYGYLTNDEKTPIEETVSIYSRRWRIENFFKEMSFLNIDKMPSIELNKISGMLAFKHVSYCLVSCLRRDIGGSHMNEEIESIFDEFINLQALVQSKGNTIHINFYRYPNELVPLFHNFNNKLISEGIDPKIPWLNNKNLQFHFK